MFTGIVTATGHIVAQSALSQTDAVQGSQDHGLCLTVQVPTGYLDDVGLGDSIALNGACMTVTSMDVVKQQFTVDVSRESLNKTCGWTNWA